MRSKRMRKYRKQFRHIILFGKVLLIWYLILFSISYITTSDTTADFTDLQEANGMIYAAGDWQVVDKSDLEFAEKATEEHDMCVPKTIIAKLKNTGTEDMLDTSTYAIYFSEHGDPRKDGEKIDLDEEEGIIPALEIGDTSELTFNATKTGKYIFVAYQLDEDQTEVLSEKIDLTCESKKEDDTEQKTMNESNSKNEVNANDKKDDSEKKDKDKSKNNDRNDETATDSLDSNDNSNQDEDRKQTKIPMIMIKKLPIMTPKPMT